LNGIYSWGAKAPIFEEILPKRFNKDITDNYEMRKHLKTYANAYDVNWSLLE